MITNDDLILERSNPIGGIQRIYRYGQYGLSLVNAPILHSYPFAWEAAVLEFDSNEADADWKLNYTTEMTSDVEVFQTDDETNSFIRRAKIYFGNGVSHES
jgi:hypothetical protein